MKEEKRELEQIRAEMREIREMLKMLKKDTTYFRKFMGNYNIPLFEETEQEEMLLSSGMNFEKNQRKSEKTVIQRF